MRPSRVNKEALQAALVAAAGNVTRAGAALKVSKTHVMRLVKRFELGAFAGEIRLSMGAAVTGRPRV